MKKLKNIYIFFLLTYFLLANNLFSQTYFSRVTNTGDLNTSAGGISSSWGDINNDDLPDILKVFGSSVKIFVNDGDGTFTEKSSGHLTSTSFFQNSAVFGDYNNDGNLDIYISNLGPGTPIQPGQPLKPQINYLYKNSGAPNFSFDLITNNGLDADSNMTWTSSWVDYDNDGDIDLLVPGDQGDKDLFYENNGDGTFTENEELLFLDPGEFSAAGGWTDFDNDGDQDLLIVNYQGVNNELYKNDLIENGEIGFTKIAGQPLVTDRDYDLAPSFGDYDNDGDMDVFIGTWIGNRNLLFTNNGNFNFSKVSGEPIVEQTWTLAYTWLDFDNDGFLDCFVANSQGEKNSLYHNNGNGSFSKLTEAEAGNIVASWGFTSGASVADYDNDGDVDIYVPGAQASLFRNDIGSLNNWLHINCQGVQSNKLGIGTKIRVKAEIDNGILIWQMREVHGGPTGDRAQNSQRVHFGLGAAVIIDSIIVEWSSGILDIYTNLEVNQFFNAIEGNSPTDIDEKERVDLSFQIFQNYPNPFNPSTLISYRLDKQTQITLEIFNITGEKVTTLISQQIQYPGDHSILWNGKDNNGNLVSSGTYLYRLKSNQFGQTRKLLLIR
jgi:hypothetical protein